MRAFTAVLCSAAASLLMVLAGCTTSRPQTDVVQLAQQVAATERAFAKTMADRNFEAFATFIDDDAVFFAGAQVLRGKLQVLPVWRPYFVEPAAPFSWTPQQVEVLDSGMLAMTSGPVHDAHGTLIGTFTSVWRKQASGVWRIVFDHGCSCAQSAR